jgi:hypothetical protein
MRVYVGKLPLKFRRSFMGVPVDTLLDEGSFLIGDQHSGHHPGPANGAGVQLRLRASVARVSRQVQRLVGQLFPQSCTSNPQENSMR